MINRVKSERSEVEEKNNKNCWKKKKKKKMQWKILMSMSVRLKTWYFSYRVTDTTRLHVVAPYTFEFIIEEGRLHLLQSCSV